MTPAPTSGPAAAFSPEEMQRRTRALDAEMSAAGVQHCVLYAANRAGSAVQWLTGWPATREAVVVHSPGTRDVLLVNFYNHVPQARQLAGEAEVRWAGPRTTTTLVEELRRRGAGASTVGVVGPMPFGVHAGLVEALGPVADLNGAHTRLRSVKSGEELERLRQAARLTDLSCEALREGARVGSTDEELVALVEGSYLPRGGSNHIHYFAITPMADPRACVPAQWPTGRILRTGDVLSCELSTAIGGDYPGQLLRTFTVAAEPTRLVAELHAVADEALRRIEQVLAPGVLPEQLVAAAEVIEEAGFTTLDDLVHGFGGGYLPPVVGSRSRTLEPPPELPLQVGMTVVVQPNVVTTDGRAGVQTGELFEVTPTGCRSLHAFPRGLGRLAG